MKTLLTVLTVLILTSTASAEVINFKDGRRLNVRVLQKDANEVKADLNGLTMTYYADEIKDIDGKSLPPAAPKAPEVTTPLAISKEDPVEKKALILKKPL